MNSALCNKLVFNTNVLYPFGCANFSHNAVFEDLDIIIQCYILKVNLPLYSNKYNSFYCMDQKYFRDPDDYDSILLGKKKPGWDIMPTIIITDNGPKVLTCIRHNGGDNHLRLYPPRPSHIT